MRKYARFYNPIVSFLLRLGLPIGPQALLTVTGRRSGLPRTTPVAINRNGTGWHLISVYGRVDWVRNLEAAGEALITRRLRRFQVT
ncbi:MAG TPA: nitroreductase family deazaflavin-dependent oxidoreductase, partial [Acidimicrobiia bacterium]